MLPDIAQQRTLTESIDETTDDCDVSDSAPKTQAALLDRARTHAAAVAAAAARFGDLSSTPSALS